MAGEDAKSKANAKLDGTTGGSPAALSVSSYRIPVRTGERAHKMINPGLLGDDQSNKGLGRDLPHQIKSTEGHAVQKFTLDDEGVQAAIGSWYGFSDEYRDSLMKRMWFLGLTKSPTDFDGAFKAWQNAVGHAANFAVQGREIDPTDVLELMADSEQGAGKRTSRTSVSRSIDLTNPETAKAWIQEAFHQSMGRKADDAEVRAMADALLAEAHRNPRISTTTSVNQFDEAGNPVGDSNTETTGGFSDSDAQAFLRNRMSSDPEAGAHQAAAELYPALMQILGAGA